MQITLSRNDYDIMVRNLPHLESYMSLKRSWHVTGVTLNGAKDKAKRFLADLKSIPLNDRLSFSPKIFAAVDAAN